MFYDYLKTENNNKMDIDDYPMNDVKEKEIVLAIKTGNLNIARKIIEENKDHVKITYNNNEIVFETLRRNIFNIESKCKENQVFLVYLNHTFTNAFNDELINRLYDNKIGITTCKNCIECVLECRHTNRIEK